MKASFAPMDAGTFPGADNATGVVLGVRLPDGIDPIAVQIVLAREGIPEGSLTVHLSTGDIDGPQQLWLVGPPSAIRTLQDRLGWQAIKSR